MDILLVEDNPGDINLIEQTFEDRALEAALHHVKTGDDAIDWLYTRGEFADAVRPDLVLLDLNLPGTDGQEVLEEIKSDPAIRAIPIVVLTGTGSDRELLKAYERHANACLVKPPDWQAFADLIESLANFWLRTAALPAEHQSDIGTHR